MRATYHCGREGNPKHNDRHFDLATAPHIDQKKTHQNYTWHRYKKDPNFKSASFEEVEREYYTRRYSKALQTSNQRYKDQRHPERCKTIEDLLKGKQTRPVETILQVGDMNNHPDKRILMSCARDMINYMNRFSNEHGSHAHMLDFAIHFDEATPHVQIRSCFDYRDKDGNYRLGQDKALQAMGIDLPDPTKPKGRYNNRKMTYDAAMREKWQEILKDHDLQIEMDPLPAKRHLDREDFIDQQIKLKSEELKKLEKSVESLRKSEENLGKSVGKLKADQQEYEEKKAQWDSRFGNIGNLALTRHKSISGHER